MSDLAVGHGHAEGLDKAEGVPEEVHGGGSVVVSEHRIDALGPGSSGVGHGKILNDNLSICQSISGPLQTSFRWRRPLAEKATVTQFKSRAMFLDCEWKHSVDHTVIRGRTSPPSR